MFFELARDFGALDEASSAKQQFATWRAADLSNRLGGGPGLLVEVVQRYGHLFIDAAEAAAARSRVRGRKNAVASRR